MFIGPAAVLTNDLHPRSTDVAGKLKRPDDWEARGVVVREGASLGANVTVIAGVVIGRWALVAAGAVVTADVPDFGLVAGVPARRIGWVGRAGVPLRQAGAGRWQCPETAELYAEAARRAAAGHGRAMTSPLPACRRAVTTGHEEPVSGACPDGQDGG